MLLATALAQTAIFVASGSVALLADLIHNFGDALKARSSPARTFSAFAAGSTHRPAPDCR
jgi:Co/Zn/Cd efflux system component